MNTTTPVHARSLSPARQRLVRLMTSVHFGRIHDLQVVRGEPVFDPAPLVLRTVKLAGHAEPAPRTGGDAALRREVLELLALLSRLGDGVVERIEIAHGLPLFAEVPDVLPQA